MRNYRKSSNHWVVYILQCSDDSLYTGITVDPDRRLLEHNYDDRLGARYTRARRPVRLMYQEGCDNRSAAAKREAEIRKLTRRQKLNLIQTYINTNKEL